MAVAETQMPQLVRDGAESEDDEREKRRKAKARRKAKKSKGKSKRARESAPFRVEIHETGIRRAGKAYEATIIRSGPGNATDRNAYSREALEDAIGRGLFEGLHAHADHQTASEDRERPERSVRTLVGAFREARLVTEGGRAAVRATFVPAVAWITELVEAALDSPKDHPLIGISIDGAGEADGTTEIGGRTYNVIKRIAHLGSADIVTRAGAGGAFHRRLSESLAGSRARAETPVALSPKRLQRNVRRALERLEGALADSDEAEAGRALRRLCEAAAAPLKPSRPAGKAEAERLLRAERERRRVAEARADELDHVLLAGRLLREADVSPRTAELWLEDLAVQRDEAAMRAVLERRTAERREQLIEVRESLGLNHVEGVPAREQAGPAVNGHGGGDLLQRMGIDPDELRSAA